MHRGQLRLQQLVGHTAELIVVEPPVAQLVVAEQFVEQLAEQPALVGLAEQLDLGHPTEHLVPVQPVVQLVAERRQQRPHAVFCMVKNAMQMQ